MPTQPGAPEPDLRDHPVANDDDALRLVTTLVERPIRRQLWFFCLDETGRPSKSILKIDIPPGPALPHDAIVIVELLSGAIGGGARGMVVAIEAGRPLVSRQRQGLLRRIRQLQRNSALADDVRWLALVTATARRLRVCTAIPCPGPELCDADRLDLRATLLVTADGIRCATPDDLCTTLEKLEHMF